MLYADNTQQAHSKIYGMVFWSLRSLVDTDTESRTKAPELLDGTSNCYTAEADIYALGMVRGSHYMQLSSASSNDILIGNTRTSRCTSMQMDLILSG